MKPEIVELDIESYDEICEIWTEAGLEYKPRGRDSLDKLRWRLKNTPTWILGIRVDSTLAGVVLLSHDGQRGWINRLAVRPRFQRRGLAKLLVSAGEEKLQEEGIELWAALIEEENRSSRSLFESLEYIEGKTLVYYSKRLSKDY